LLSFAAVPAFNFSNVAVNFLVNRNEEDSPTLNLLIWPLDGALDKGRRFGGQWWRQGKTS
jgi:hypothetical protein